MDSLQPLPKASLKRQPRTPALASPRTLDLGSTATPVFLPSTPVSNPHRTAPRARFSWKKTFFFLLGLFFLLILSTAGFLWSKAAHISRTLSFENQPSISLFSQIKATTQSLFTPHAPLKETDGRINILLLGRAGEHYPGKNLTDTLMLASIDTHTHRVALLSFPRDLYTPIGQSENFTKINSIYQIGLDMKAGVGLLRETIENIAGIPIHYSLVVDFDGFEKAINALGGISVDVPRDLIDTRYPGKNYSYETFEIHQGWQKLDGATALKYVRERHADPEGDFGRAKRQQQVMQAVRDKAFSTGTFLNILTLSRLLDALGESVKTDITPEEMESFLSLIRTLDTKNISTTVIDAWQPESLLRVSHIPTPSGNAFILVPRTGNWKEITHLAQHLFEFDGLKQEQAHIESEVPSIRILSAPTQASLAQTLQNFLKTELHFSTITLDTHAFQNAPERSTIQDATGGKKPYSHNALLSRFDLESLSNLSPQVSSNQTDFLLTLGEDLGDNAFIGETGATPEEIDTTVLPPEKPARKHRKH